MFYQRFKATALHDKTAPIITTFVAMVAFALSLVALLSNSKDGLSQYSIVTLNTSTLLQNVIQVDMNGASMTARGLEVVQTPAPTPSPVFLDERQFSIPGPSQVASFFGSIGSGVASALTPKPTSTGNPPSTGGAGGSGNLLTDIEAFFNMLLGAGAEAAGNGVDQLINTLVKDITTALNVQEWYGIYMTGFCDGHYTTSGGLNTTVCTAYKYFNVPAPKSTLTIGTATLDFSSLNIPEKLNKGATQVKAILTAILALQITGIVSSGILIVLAPLSILFSFLNRRFIHATIAFLTTLATVCLGINAIIGSAITIIVTALVNGLGGGLGINAYSGGPFLALMWVSCLFLGVAAALWAWRWHAHKYVRREGEQRPPRTAMEKTSESAEMQR